VWLTRLYRRFQHLVHELGKFGIVGTVAYAIDSVILIGLTELEWNEFAAKTIAATIAATVAFLGNRFWTWRHRIRSNLAREYTLYFLFNAIGLGIALACLWINKLLGQAWPEIFNTTLAVFVAANVVGLAAGSLFRFWTYRRFVFPAAKPAELAPAAISPGSPG
jgi:putative flippase GtrA